MENISYIGLSQQIALRQEMDVTANNIANMNTPGYKSNGVLFLEFLNRSRQDPDTIRQVSDISTYRDLAPGSLMQTHNTLDFAINGEGYFVVQTPDGPRYTRDGGFQLNEQRQLVNKSGYALQGDGGPITIPPEAAQVHLTAGGVVTTEEGDVGRIRVVRFDNEQALKKTGENLYDAATENPQTVDSPRLAQGALEGSNVNPVVEMNKMIEVLRMYQATQRMLQNDHERIRGTIQKLTRV